MYNTYPLYIELQVYDDLQDLHPYMHGKHVLFIFWKYVPVKHNEQTKLFVFIQVSQPGPHGSHKFVA